MSEASLAVQKAIRSRLIGTPALVALVPADHILDRNQRPAPDPSIVLGEDQVVNPGVTIARDVVRVYSTLHVWKREPSLAGVKSIAGEIAKAIWFGPGLDLETGYQWCDSVVESFRALRDPDGETSHGILTINSLVRVLQ
ncbi:MAG: DUF3168 domain-containing protein [Pseudomonadota bacterium]